MGSRRPVGKKPAGAGRGGAAADQSAARVTPIRTVQVLYHAPIPIGHRVEVQFFKDMSGGDAPAQHKVIRETPIITDLDTGIVYSALAHHDHAGKLRDWLDVPFPDRLEPRPNVFFAERITGRVLGCRIITEPRNPGTMEVMTQIRVAPDPNFADEDTLEQI